MGHYSDLLQLKLDWMGFANHNDILERVNRWQRFLNTISLNLHVPLHRRGSYSSFFLVDR